MRRWWMLMSGAVACAEPSKSDGPPSGADTAEGVDTAEPAVPDDPCDAVGDTRCDGLWVETCVETADGPAWSEAEACPGDQRCREDACADPSAAQVAQADAAADFIDDVVRRTGYHAPLDAPAITADARGAIFDGDGSDGVYYTAMWGALNAVPQGHQGLYAADCRSPEMYSQNISRLGVCARPHEDGLVVTVAHADNPLGLAVGDRVVRAGDDVAEGILDAAALRPVCGVTAPAPSGRHTFAAASFFGTVPPGMELEVAPVVGAAFTVEVPADPDTRPISCQDPLGRDIDFNADSYVRDDGIAVVRVPRFYPMDATLPADPTEAELAAFIADFQADIEVAFLAVSDAPAIIWDVRSNYGGMTVVGLAIAGGMSGARDEAISYCQARDRGSDPPEFSAYRYAEYAVEPGGPFETDVPVAILIDGLDYSAADYFPLAVDRATDALIVGTPTAGAFGGTGPYVTIDTPPQLTYAIDPNRCVDIDGNPLEGTSVTPHIAVSYDPTDLSMGVDTVMEAAATALRTP